MLLLILVVGLAIRSQCGRLQINSDDGTAAAASAASAADSDDCDSLSSLFLMALIKAILAPTLNIIANEPLAFMHIKDN